MTKKSFLAIAIAAAVILTAAVAVVLALRGGETKLVVCDTKTNKIYAEYEIEDKEEFSVSFIHSVNLTEVTDCYFADGGYIVCDKCVYSSFGAGMPTEWEEDWRVSYDDGKITISGLNIKQKKVNYIVGTVYDHVLKVGNEEIVLNELCGKNAKITLKIKTPLFGG
jgi:hypothetical protein